MRGQVVAREEQVLLDQDEFIVSKTNLKGEITYVNRTFMEISLFAEHQVMRQNHNIIRHPDMPRGVYRMMWEQLKQRQEFFGYVKNLCSDGSYYWVFANITPEFDEQGKHCGFLSVRRKPPSAAVEVIKPIYQKMCSIEASTPNKKRGEELSLAYFEEELAERNSLYQHFVIDLFQENGGAE
ncbi:PAS domain-containing protein [Psychrobium sp. 1_MG-2023]|uniref:PAS domain-containing protein n=1 Tax=Psychrobium sp. 1_MG-2023 TaxID=3062624 RepID=UPI000C32FA27|nr:PAS domain-containing protein [Psychrobium sp. 1_MG-2023]MDP2561269.1 PAS domain-containing protein [Psychrobium sp. 1_MG-2023]PKF55231.1 aerotaxis receptor Aer [Alteromonadales bacterium alter-6D02]